MKEKRKKKEKGSLQLRKLLKENLNKEIKRKKIVNKSVLVKRSNSIKNEIQSKMVLKSEEKKRDEEPHCIICGETFVEDWILVLFMKEWSVKIALILRETVSFMNVMFA